MLDDCRASNNMRIYRKQMVLDRHNYAITEPCASNPRWQTYVKLEGGVKRRLVRARGFDDLLEKLYNIYFVENGLNAMTMGDLFREWLSYKECLTDSQKTIRRHEQHWKKYFSDIAKKKVRSYDRLELQKDCNVLVRTNQMTSKEWQNVKTILSGMFDYAFEKHYIKQNIMSNVKITVKFRQVNKKTGKTETYQTEDLKLLMAYIDQEFKRTNDIALLAVKLDLYIGARVGELVSLKWCDLVDLNHIHIVREEIKDSIRQGDKWVEEYKVVDHTKTHQDRFIPLVPAAIGILNYIRLKMVPGASEDDFIFMRDGKRLTARQVNYALEKACAKLDIPVKRSHKIRKTVASLLNAGGVPLDSIREFLGHSNLNTTLGYIYNPLTEKETYDLIKKAL